MNKKIFKELQLQDLGTLKAILAEPKYFYTYIFVSQSTVPSKKRNYLSGNFEKVGYCILTLKGLWIYFI